MNFTKAAFALASVFTLSSALPANAFSARRLAVQECNNRIRQGLVAPVQSAFNACVDEQETFLAPVVQTPGARGFCAGVEQSIQEDAEVRNNPAMAAMVRQSLGC